MKLNIEDISKKGEKIYKSYIKPKVEKKYKGKIIAIELENKKFFIGDTQIETLKKARSAYPDKIFYTKRIGFKSVYKVR